MDEWSAGGPVAPELALQHCPTKPSRIPIVQPQDSTSADSDPYPALRIATGFLFSLSDPPSLCSLHHQNGVISPSPRRRPLKFSSAHCQSAHDRLGHTLGPQIHFTSAPGQSQTSTRRHTCRPPAHRLVHQRPQPWRRRRPHGTHCAHHGQPQTSQLLPTAGEAWRGNICYCKYPTTHSAHPHTDSCRSSRAATARRAS